MKLFRDFAAWFGRIREGDNAAVSEVDPFDHPAIRRMSPRELADLPFPRRRAVIQCR